MMLSPTMIKIAGAAALVAALGGKIWWQDRTIAAKEQEVMRLEANLSLVEEYYEQAAATANNNAKALEEYKKNADEAIRAISEQHKRDLERAKAVVRIQERIEHEKKDGDAPVAPVLRNALHGLREINASAETGD